VSLEREPAGAVDGAIDIHTHVVPQAFPAYAGRHAGCPWPSMVPAHACHRHVVVSGKVYRTVSHACWDCAERRLDMQRMRVGRQVLSPMPELLSYWMEPEDGLAMCRFLNGLIAEMVAREPAHFTGLGMVPLQDVDLAIRELDRLIHEDGLAGVEIAGHVNERVIGDPAFRPFFEAAQAWGAAVFVHPLRPSGRERLVGPPLLEQALAFPGDTGLAAASLLTGGTLAALPGLRIALSHGGGSLQALLPRLQHVWEQVPTLREQMPQRPLDAARQFYVDSLVYDGPLLLRLLEVFGRERVVIGSDHPFVIMEHHPVDRLQALGLDPYTLGLLLHGNARRWLGAGSADTVAAGGLGGGAAPPIPDTPAL